MTSLVPDRPILAERLSPARPPVGQKVRIALLGCGAATRELHMPVLTGHEGVEVTALIDRDRRRAHALARDYRIGTVLGDLSELTRELADAVVVCTPPAHHAPAALELAGRGFHVLVEKPLATRYSDAEEAVRAADDAGVALSVSVFRRLLPATRLMRGLIDSQFLGRPMGFDVEEGEVYSWPTATLGNMRKETAGGGVLIDFGSHTFDRLLAFFDGPGEILGYRDNNRGGGVESDCEVRLRFLSAGRPVDGRVELSRTRNLRNSFRVRCERGTLELASNERYRVRVLPDGARATDPLTGTPRGYEVHAAWAGQDESPWYEAFRVQIDDWLEAIRTGHPPRLGGATVLPALKLITDCYARTPESLPEPGIDERLEAGVHVGNGPRRRVLVTGATGFIGGRLAELLALRDGWQVRALVHNPARASRLARLPVEMVVGELNGSADLSGLVEGCDAVVHCAIGTAWGNRREIFDVTVGGTRQLAAAARAAGVGRFVHISTFAVHDLTADGVVDETTPVCRQKADAWGTHYAASKADAEDAVREAAASGLSALILRLPNVYGPYSTIFTNRPLEALRHGRLVLVGPADRIPSNTVHIDNVVEAVTCGLAAGDSAVRGETFVLGGDSDLTWADFYGYFARSMGADLRAISDEDFARKHPRRRFDPARWLLTPVRGAAAVATSSEFFAFAKRVAKTQPLYSLLKGAVGVLPAGVKARGGRLLGLGGPVVYHRAAPTPTGEEFEFDLTRPRVDASKVAKVLGYRPVVPREQAMAETLAWARYARVLSAGSDGW
jgi:predicted dehydrogenase/nucleoside-diphosphate-sugar epimerase